jgi:hypothetical protein
LLTLEGWVRTDGAVLLAYPAIGAIFILSVFLALLAILVRYVHVHIPVVSTYTFETLPIAFLLLRVTCSVAFEKTAERGVPNIALPPPIDVPCRSTAQTGRGSHPASLQEIRV